MSLARTLLFGRDRERSLRAVAVGLAGLVVMVFFWNAGRLAEDASDLLPVDVVGTIAVLLLAVACVHAYTNDGLVVNWGVVALVVFGGTVNGVGAGLQPPSSVERAAFGLVAALAAGVAVGTVGFVLGAGARRLVDPW